MKKTNTYLYTLKITLSYINRYPIYWFWFFLRLIYVGMILITPIVLGSIINVIVREDFNNTHLYWLAGIYVALLFVAPIIEILTVQKVLAISGKIARDFRREAVQLLEHAPVDFFKSRNRGAYLKIIDASHYAIYRISEDILHRYVTSIGSVVGIFLSSIIFRPWVIIIFFLSSFLSLANLVVFGRKERLATIEFSRAEESFTGGLSEFLNNFKTVFYLNLFKKQEADLGERINLSYLKRLEIVKCSMRKWFNNNQLQQITTILIFIFGLLAVVHGNLTLGALTIIMTFSANLSGQMGTLLGYSEDYVERTSALERFYDELAIPLSNQVAKKSGLLEEPFERLATNKLVVERDERENLSNVTFEIHAGEKMAIVGHTGGGKSTFLDVILKAITDYKGSVSMNDVDYRKLTGKDISEVFSIVPQEVQLFRGTLRDNIASSKETPTDTELEKLCAICGLSSFVKTLPNRYEEIIFEGAANISGGERQRIGIARALFQNHPFLVLDEATASLDPKTERSVIENIIASYPDITLLYITHKYALLDRFEKIFVMDDGRFVEQGTFEELKTGGGLFKELYTASMHVK